MRASIPLPRRCERRTLPIELIPLHLYCYTKGFFSHTKVLRWYKSLRSVLCVTLAAIAQLGERQTEDLKVPGSIPGGGKFFFDYKGISKANKKVIHSRFVRVILAQGPC